METKTNRLGIACQLVRDMSTLIYQCDQCGLHATARLIDKAMQRAGFELAELIEKNRSKGDRQ